MSRRVLILCRQSLTRQGSVSLAEQERELRAHHEGRGDAVVGVLSAPSVRGWKEDRADIAEALARARRREYDVLAVYDLSRLARKVRIQETVVDELERVGLTVESLREPWSDDPSMRQMAAVFSERMTRDLKHRMQGVAANRFRQGKLVGRAPYGYQKRDNRLEIVPDHAAVVREIHARYLAGDGSSAIATDLTARAIPSPAGSPRWRADVVLRILANPVYVGVQRVKGSEHPGAWEPILDRAAFDAVQALRATGRAAKTRHDGRSWLQGLAVHACGAKLYLHGGNHATRPDGRRYVWFYFCCARGYAEDGRCRVRPLAMARIRFEAAIRDRLLADLAGMLDWDAALATARRRLDARDVDADLRAAEARRADLVAERERVSLWFRKGRMPQLDAEAEDDRLAAQIAAADRELAALAVHPSPASYAQVHARLAALGDALRAAGPSPAALREIVIALGAVPELGPDGATIRYPSAVADVLGCSERALR